MTIVWYYSKILQNCQIIYETVFDHCQVVSNKLSPVSIRNCQCKYDKISCKVFFSQLLSLANILVNPTRAFPVGKSVSKIIGNSVPAITLVL